MSDGYMTGGSYVQMETTSSDDACARKVKSLLPLANGITWYVGSGGAMRSLLQDHLNTLDTAVVCLGVSFILILMYVGKMYNTRQIN